MIARSSVAIMLFVIVVMYAVHHFDPMTGLMIGLSGANLGASMIKDYCPPDVNTDRFKKDK